jgi:hypothetical protein
MFAGLCGDKYAKKVVYLTTKWDEVVGTEAAEVAKQQEADLQKSHWNDMTLHGATSGRFDINDPKSLWVIINKTTHGPQPVPALLLQEEVVDHRKLFNQTSAVKALFGNPKRSTAYKTREVKAGNLDSGDIVIV